MGACVCSGGIIMDKIASTPREYARNRQSLPFGAYRLVNDGNPDWRKARGGLIAVTDGTERQYVSPGLLFGVEIVGGKPVIVSYWRKGAMSGLCGSRPYTLKSVQQMVTKGQITRRKWPLTYQDMITMVRNIHPRAWIPDPVSWYAEYGLSYDEATGEIRNPRGLREDD